MLRLARELAAAHPDDWLGREDLLVELEEQRECRAEAAALAQRLRVPHYRRVVGRLKRTHSLRDQLLADWDHVVRQKLAFAVYDYRAGLDGATADLQGIEPPEAVKGEHRRYVRSLRTLHRRVIRLERSREYEAARRTHASLPGLARAADRAHRELMDATSGQALGAARYSRERARRQAASTASGSLLAGASAADGYSRPAATT